MSNKYSADFPVLRRLVHGKPLVYLDNAATTLKPQSVIDSISGYYSEHCANIHRGVHLLSQEATDLYEQSRRAMKEFLGANSEKEIIFTRGTTDSINLAAQSLGQMFKAGDEIVISHMEHHSNIVPWQMLRDRIGIVLKVIPILDDGSLDMDEAGRLITDKTRLVSIVQISNSLGTINPVKKLINLAHSHGAITLIDGAQAAAHTPVNVKEMGCDLYVLSAHKILGPTGAGVLYGRESLLEKMPPVQGGGDMILSVTFEKTLYNDLPHKFEAGTPPIASVIGMKAALQYIQKTGFAEIERIEKDLLDYGTSELEKIDGLKLIGTAAEKASILSFTLDWAHPHDIGTLLDHEGIAVRTGHHCTQPVMDRFKIPATARASLSFYNSREDIDALIAGIAAVAKVMK